MLLRQQFETRSVADMAALYRVSKTAMRNHLLAFGLNRSTADANSVRYRKAPVVLSLEQAQLVYGSLLGDACIYRQIKPTHFTLKVWFAQGEAQLKYLKYKRSIMGGSRISQRPEGSNWGRPVYQFAYSNTQGLLAIENCVTLNGVKRVTPEWLAQLGWRGIAIWYQDDGSLLRQNGKPSCIRFYTNAFTRAEVDLLCDFLGTRGLSSLSVSHGNTALEPVINAFRRDDLCAFITQLKPYSVPCLNYKFRI